MNVASAMNRLVEEIAAAKAGRKIALVGIQSGGVPIAQRLRKMLTGKGLAEIVSGTLDIGLYRDDTNLANRIPVLVGSEIPYDISDFDTILVDDVLFTGRTIRAAMNQLADYGRPSCIELAVLVDRGHREVPIYAAYVGVHLETARSQHVSVKLAEIDGLDSIEVRNLDAAAKSY